jgi:transcriptional regulator with XRE-family HTH domain
MELDVFAKRLKELRLSRRLTLQNVGDAVGSNRNTIGNLENAQKSPSLSMVLALSEFFDVSVDYLVGRSEDDTARESGHGEATKMPPAQNEGHRKLHAMIETLREDNAEKALSYVAFLQSIQKREDKKNRRAHP